MANIEQERQFFELLPKIPINSEGKRVLKVTRKDKAQMALIENKSVYEIEETFLQLEKSGFWSKIDDVTYEINPKYSQYDYNNLSRLEHDVQK